jgi:hypothetical protein
VDPTAAFFAKGDDPLSRYRFIAAEKAQHSVAQLCRVLQVALSGYHAWRSLRRCGVVRQVAGPVGRSPRVRQFQQALPPT